MSNPDCTDARSERPASAARKARPSSTANVSSLRRSQRRGASPDGFSASSSPSPLRPVPTASRRTGTAPSAPRPWRRAPSRAPTGCLNASIPLPTSSRVAAALRWGMARTARRCRVHGGWAATRDSARCTAARRAGSAMPTGRPVSRWANRPLISPCSFMLHVPRSSHIMHTLSFLPCDHAGWSCSLWALCEAGSTHPT